MSVTSANLGIVYDRVNASVEGKIVREADGRWIGRCKRCKATHRLEGRLTAAHRERGGGDYVVVDPAGVVWTTAAMGSDSSIVQVRCGDHWCNLRRVHEGTKQSKHECGARCTNATGPSCDCRCKGKNHGSHC